MESIDRPMAPSCPLTELKAAAPLFDFVQIAYNTYEVFLAGKSMATVEYYFGKYHIAAFNHGTTASKSKVGAKLMEYVTMYCFRYWTREELVDAVQAFKAALEVYSCAWPYLHRLVPPQLTIDIYEGLCYSNFTKDNEYQFDGAIGHVNKRVNAIVTRHMSIVDAIWEILPLPIAEAVTEEFLVHVELGPAIRKYCHIYGTTIDTYPVIDGATGAEILRAENPEEWLEPLKNYRAGVSHYTPHADRVIYCVDNFDAMCAALREKYTWRDRDGRGVLDHFPPVICATGIKPRPAVDVTYMELDRYFASRK